MTDEPRQPPDEQQRGRVARVARRVAGRPQPEREYAGDEFTRRFKQLASDGRVLRDAPRLERSDPPEAPDAEEPPAADAESRIAELEALLAEALEYEQQAAAEQEQHTEVARELDRIRARLGWAEATMHEQTVRAADAEAAAAASDAELNRAAERIAALQRELADARAIPRAPAVDRDAGGTWTESRNGHGQEPPTPTPLRASPQRRRASVARAAQPVAERDDTDLLGRPRADAAEAPPGVPRARVPHAADGDDPTLLNALWRRRWLIVAVGVLAAAIAFFRANSETKMYSAQASLQFQTNGPAQQFLGVGGPDNPTELTRAANTAARVISLPVVAGRTASALHNGFTGGQVKDAVAVNAASNADIVNVTATAKSPELAVTLADTYANQYIAFSRSNARAPIIQAQQSLQAQLDASTDPTVRRSLSDRIAQLETLAALQTGGAKLVNAAVPPSKPSSPKPLRDLGLGLLAGLLLGTVLALALELGNRAVRRPSEVERMLHAPVLARIPDAPALSRGRSYEDAQRDPGVAEAFRTLQTNLRYLDTERPLSSVLVLSPGPADGKSTVARQLAAASAAAGKRTLLIDAGVGAADGLGLVVAGLSGLDQVTTPAGPPDARFDLIPAGFAGPSQTQQLESDRARELIAELEDRYELIVIDGPAAAAVSRALPWARLADGLVIVCRLGVTSRAAIRDLRRITPRLPTPVLGLVLNGTEKRSLVT